MTKKVLFVSAILLAVALVAIAADSITGKWVYDMPAFGRGGGGGGGAAPAGPPRQVTMDLKADGATLTGSVTTPGFARGGGDPPPPTTTPISNGKVNGDSFSFELPPMSRVTSNEKLSPPASMAGILEFRTWLPRNSKRLADLKIAVSGQAG